MVDIHSHILWGLDDGAESLEESLQMVRMAASAGTTDIVATPHASHEYRFQPDLVAERLAELRAACGNTPRIHPGCDFHLMFENIEDALRNPAKYTINGGSYLMVEFSDSVIPPHMSAVFDRFRAVGIESVITHPERNLVLQRAPKTLDDFVQNHGCLVQVTAQSLTGLFGKGAEVFAWRLFDRGMVHFVASDAHEPLRRTPRMDTARAAITERYGEDRARQVLVDNPGAVIRNEFLPFTTFLADRKPKRWFQFW